MEIQKHQDLANLQTLRKDTPKEIVKVMSLEVGERIKNDTNFHLLFKRIGMSLSIHEPLSVEESNFIKKFCLERFYMFTEAEIEQAFDMYCASQLDFKDGHYGIVSKEFVGKVLQSYMRYKESKKMEAIKYKQKNMSEKSYTDEEKHQSSIEYYTTCLAMPYQKFIDEDVWKFTEGSLKYLYIDLTKHGIFNDVLGVDEVLSLKRKIFEDEKDNFTMILKEQMVKDMSRRNEINNIMEAVQEITDNPTADEIPLQLKDHCSIVFIKHFFRYCKKNKVTVMQLIPKENNYGEIRDNVVENLI